MNFFKKLFSKKKKPTAPAPVAPPPPPVNPIPPSNISIQPENEDIFHKRYRPMTNEDDAKLLDGSVKMIGNYARLALQKLPKAAPQNHPENLDFVTKKGYLNWMKSVGMGDGDIAAQLCFALSEYMVKQHDMILYHDHMPEYKFRMFTLRKMVNGVPIFVYPLEFTLKVVQEEKSFLAFEKLVIDQEKKLLDKDTLGLP